MTEQWQPEGPWGHRQRDIDVAQFDQAHAEAIEQLREADTFLVAFATETDDDDDMTGVRVVCAGTHADELRTAVMFGLMSNTGPGVQVSAVLAGAIAGVPTYPTRTDHFIRYVMLVAAGFFLVGATAYLLAAFGAF